MFKVVLQKVSKSYAASAFSLKLGKVALDDVSLTFSHGERIGLVGCNGAGKSTLLSILAGVSEPTSGHLEIHGRVSAILTLGAFLREEMTGRENIRLDASLQEMDPAALSSHIEAVAEFSELGEALDRPVRTYSTGMKSRLAFSAITQIHPEILLIDEALSVGDSFFSGKATAKMNQICAEGGIVVLVSHNLESLRKMTDRCIWLERGRIRRDGPTHEIVNEYLKTTLDFDFGSEADSLSQVQLYQGGQGTQIINSSRDFRVRIEMQRGASAEVEVVLRRLDGLFLDKEKFRGVGPCLEFEMRDHGLAQGFYAFDVYKDGARSGVYEFEVRDPNAPKGASPILNLRNGYCEGRKI